MATTSDSRNPTDCCGFRRQSAKKIHTPVNLFDSSWHLFYFYKESMKRHNHQMPPFCVWVQSPVPTCSVTITSTDLLLVDAMSQSPTQTCCLCVLCHIHQYIPAACVCSVTVTNTELLLVCALSHSPIQTCCGWVLCQSGSKPPPGSCRQAFGSASQLPRSQTEASACGKASRPALIGSAR